MFLWRGTGSVSILAQLSGNEPCIFLPTLFRINGISNFRRIQKEANSTHGNKTSFHFAKKQFIAQQKSPQQRKLTASQFCPQPAQCSGSRSRRSSSARGRKSSSRRKYSPSAGKNVEREMHEFKRGRLKMGRSGKKVKSRKQAIAIGLSEARRSGKKVPAKKSSSSSSSSHRKAA